MFSFFFFINTTSVWGISQQLLWDRCVFRTARPKTRKNFCVVFLSPGEIPFICSSSYNLNPSCLPGTELAAFSCETLVLRYEVQSLNFLSPTLHDCVTFPFLYAQPVMSDHGLLTTVAYKLGRDKPACYALEVAH